MLSTFKHLSIKPKRSPAALLSCLIIFGVSIVGPDAAIAEGSEWSGVTSVTGNSTNPNSKNAGDGNKTASPAAASGSNSAGGGSPDTSATPANTSTNTSTEPATPKESNAVPVWDGSGANPNTPTVAPAVPAKAPVGDGRPQIALQMPPPKQLAYMLRMNEPAARSRIKIATDRCRQHLAKAGMDANIDVDDAMELSKPVINIYLKKSVGDNILAHGFCMQAFLMQYQRKPSGRVEPVRCARIGESPEIYSGADWEDKVVTLVDAYISARHHQLKAAASGKAGAAKGKPGSVKGKKK